MADLEDVTLDGRPLQSLRVADLKVALEERGLSKSGPKNALIKRLKGALMLENLQRTSTPHIGLQPNSQIGEEMSQNSIIKQYLAKQQELLRQRLEREAREVYDTNEQEDHTEINNSTSCPQTQGVTPMLVDQHKPPCPSGGEGLSGKVNQMEDNRNKGADMSSHPASAPPVSASGSVAMQIVGGEHQSERGHTSRRVPADSDEEDGDDDWVSSTRRRSRRQPARARVTRERSGASRHLQQQHIPSVLSPQLRQPTPPPSPPPELSFPLPDTPKQSPPSPGVRPARQLSSSTSSSGSSSSSSRSSSPEPQRSGQSERKPGPLTLLARKMESEGAFCSAGWHSGDRESDRQDGSSPSTTQFSGVEPQEGIVYASTQRPKSTGHVQFGIIPSTTQGVGEAHSPHIELPVRFNATAVEDRKSDSLKRSLQQEREERQRSMELERVKPLEWEQEEREQADEQNRLAMVRTLEAETHEKERLEREKTLGYERLESNKVLVQKREHRENLERAKALEQERLQREKALEQERLQRDRALEQERLEREKVLERERMAREKALEQERLEREMVLEQERLERERIEREKALEQERLERERIERQKALEQERLERERIERQKALEQERLERERIERQKALEQERLERERIEREKALEQERLERERIEREKALEQERLERERIEREKALEQERLERERIEREKALEQERLERERIEREKALEQERVERERIEREKALEQERLERERIEREKALEQERLEREKALEQKRLEREKALEQERLEREKALEQERLEREKALEQERLEREKALEQERLEREKALEQERLEREKALEQERLEREMALEQERLERERIEREKALEQERLERERIEREKALEQERLERERIEREKALEEERLERERKEREKALEQERLERERIEREKALEQERLERERKEREKALEQERLERERIEREKALEQERLERERIEREKALEQERLERERIERQKALEQERLERERIAREKALEQERLERERIEREKALEQERLERERIEREKALEQERMERERIEREKALEQERLERERIERERALEQKRLERERIERERALEQERLERERLERERALEQERLERERLERERALEQERLERERLERERALEQERLERERLEREKALEQERLERERLEREKALEQERLERVRLEREKALEQERLERERLEREKALEQERLERVRLEREKALEQERLERERIEREKVLEQERLERERLEREKALEQERLERERLEREKALEQERLERERLEREKALEQERLERERLEREKALEQERLEREKALEQERLEREKALEQEQRERLERETALAQEQLQKEKMSAQQKVVDKEKLEREKSFTHERMELERKENEKIESQKALKIVRITQDKTLEQEREEKEKTDKESTLEQERTQKETVDKEQKEKVVQLERLERQKEEKLQTVKVGGRWGNLAQESKKALEFQELEKKPNETGNEHASALKQVEQRVMVAKPARENTLPLSKQRSEICLIPLPTPPPLSTGADKKSTEAAEQEGCDARDPMASGGPPDAESSASVSPTSQGTPLLPQCSFRKPRFIRDPPIHLVSSPTSTFLKRPRTFTDSPNPQVSSSANIGVREEEAHQPSSQNTDPQIQINVEVVGGPLISSRTKSEGETAVITTLPESPKDQRTNNLLSEEKEQAGSVEQEQHSTKDSTKKLRQMNEGKCLSSPVDPVVQRGREAKKEEKTARGSSSSNESSSSDSDSGSSSSTSSGSSSSSPERITRVRKEGKVERDPSPQPNVPVESWGDSLKESQKGPVCKPELSAVQCKTPADGTTSQSKFFKASAREEQKRKRDGVSDGEEEKRDKKRQVKMNAIAEQEKIPELSDEMVPKEEPDLWRSKVALDAFACITFDTSKSDFATPKASSTRKISLCSSKTSPGSSNIEIEQKSSVAASRKRRWGSSTAVTARKPSISITTDSLKSLIPDIGPCLSQEPVVDLNTEELVLSGGEDDASAHPPQALQIQRTVTQEVPVEIQENGEEEAVSSGPADVTMVHEAEVDTSFTKAMETKSPPVIHNVEMEPVIPCDTLNRRSISQQMSGVSVTIDDPVRTARHPSPPRGNVSTIVHVCNLVRPFTLGQLKELLGRTGTMVEHGFWIDKIKSHCYVTYSSPEEAVATRAALHGVKWPQSNPKLLSVEFCQQEELDYHKGLGTADRPGTEEQGPSFGRSRASGLPSLLPERDQWAERDREMDRRERSRAERDWDRNKAREFGKPGEGRDGGLRRSPPKEARGRDRDKTTEEPPAKLLDDLFRKTKATPCIYWLPHTEEQIVQRKLARAERRKLREQRLKELEEMEKQEEERKERTKAGVAPAGDRSESEKEKDRERDRERNRERVRERDRDKEREADKRKESYRRDGTRGAGGSSRRSHSRSDPRERRR